jgi:transcriptional regulator with GAF, ATPase, and Fis domain
MLASEDRVGSGLEIVGSSPTLEHLLRQSTLVAATGSTLLILGNTGAGKELIARAIHTAQSATRFSLR